MKFIQIVINAILRPDDGLLLLGSRLRRFRPRIAVRAAAGPESPNLVLTTQVQVQGGQGGY